MLPRVMTSYLISQLAVTTGSIILTLKQNAKALKWHHSASPKNKKARIIPSPGKVMGKVFWDAEGCILFDFLPRMETVDAVCYGQMIQKL
jgi:hypothetical protein